MKTGTRTGIRMAVRTFMDNPSDTRAETERNFGPQPLDALMLQLGLDNHALVAASQEPLTHKAVQRARKGRRLTPRMRQRIADALHRAATLKDARPERPWYPRELFNY